MLLRNVKERDHFEDVGVDGMIILIVNMEMLCMSVWTVQNWFIRLCDGNL